jgi:two-component system response regulator YesN
VHLKKVLIADDEPLVRVAFKTLVDWKEIGFDIYAEASNGEEALKILSASPADIVITDIKMPVMDGLSLTKWIKAKLPDTVVGVLSCYDEFKLVKEAFKLGAFDYMLKTEINGESLVDLLKRAERVLVEHKEKLNGRSFDNKLVKKNLDKLKEGFFKKLIWNVANVDEMLDSEIKELNLRLRNKRNYIGAFKTDDISIIKEVYGDGGQELFIFSVLNIVNEILDEYENVKFFRTEDETQLAGLMEKWLL